MLTLKEHQEIAEAVQSMDPQFTDDVIAKAEYYTIDEDEITLQSTVTVYDENGAPLVTVNVEDYDTAVAYLEDMFDLEPLDPEDVDPRSQAINTRYGQSL